MDKRFQRAAGLVFSAALTLASQALPANQASPAAEDPVLERRAMDLAVELRCLVCQNQTLADSNAALAVGLRNQIREQLKKGASEREIVDYMVARYGDFVLYRPPFKATTVLLWLGPLVLVLAGLYGLYRVLARRRAHARPEALDQAQHQRARRLLDAGSSR